MLAAWATDGPLLFPSLAIALSYWELPGPRLSGRCCGQCLAGAEIRSRLQWGQICRVIWAPELPVELAWGLLFVLSSPAFLTSLQVYSWGLKLHIPFSPWICSQESHCKTPIHYLALQIVILQKGVKKNHSILGWNDIVNLFHLLWLFLVVSFCVICSMR